MGSLSSRRVSSNMDTSDDETVDIPTGLDIQEFLSWVRNEKLGGSTAPMKRLYISTQGEPRDTNTTSESFRLLQWNVLSQALGSQVDNFVECPREALEWKYRRYKMVEEILSFRPDIICLQEVDHFRFLERILTSQGYVGQFTPKPDSPCLYVPKHNGPDGCAMFFQSQRFELVENKSRVLEVTKVQTNQVAIMMTLRDKHLGKEFLVVTTHLKARQGPLLTALRTGQGGDILSFLAENMGNRPVILCGDFNAEPSEPVYTKILKDSLVKMSSAYSVLNGGREPSYTTWKVRQEGEVKHNLDYIFFTNDLLKLRGGYYVPEEGEIGPQRVPSFRYPSDHFSLVCDFDFKNDNNT